MKEKSSVISWGYRSISTQLSVRYKNVLFPFDQSLFLEAIQGIGFVLKQKPYIPPIQKFRLAIDGDIAFKGSVRLSIQDEKQILGLKSTEPGVLVNELEMIEKLLGDVFEFKSEENAFFYEFLGDFTVEATGDPIEKFRTLSKSFEFVNDLTGIFGQEVGLYSLRLLIIQ